MTRDNYWQTLPWLNWRHAIGRQATALTRSPLGRFTALSTADSSTQRDQPLAAYLVGYPIPPIEELRSAFLPAATPPFRFSPAIEERTTLSTKPTTIQDVDASAIAPPVSPHSPAAAPDADAPNLPPLLPAIQRQPLGRTAPLGKPMALIAETILSDRPGSLPSAPNRPPIPANERPVVSDEGLPLRSLNGERSRIPERWPEANRPNLPTPETFSPANLPGTETAADRNRPNQPSSERPAAGSPPKPPTATPPSALTPPSTNATPSADSLARLDAGDAGVIQPRPDQAPMLPPAIAEPRSSHLNWDANASGMANQPPSQPGPPPHPADVSEQSDPDTLTEGPELSDAADTAEGANLAGSPPRPATADPNSDTVHNVLPVDPVLPGSPISENPPDVEARSQPQRPSRDHAASPPPSSPDKPSQRHSSTEADTTPPVAKTTIAQTDSTPTPESLFPPHSPDFPTPPVAADVPSDWLRDVTPDGTQTPPVSQTNRPPTQGPGPEAASSTSPQTPELDAFPIPTPQNQSATAPKIPLLPNIQRYVTQTDRPRSRREAFPAPLTQRPPLAELRDYLVPSTPPPPSPQFPIPSRPQSPTPEPSSDEALASPPSTPQAQRLTVPPHPPISQASRPPILPVQMRALESPTTRDWESQFDLEPDFPELEPADFSTDLSLDDLESEDMTAEANPATEESPQSTATPESEADVNSEAVTLTADVGSAEADAELLDHLAEWVYRDLRSHLRRRREAQFGQSIALPPWYPQHPGFATQTVRSESNLPDLPLPPTLHHLTTVVRQQVESRLRKDWERFPEHRYPLRF